MSRHTSTSSLLCKKEASTAAVPGALGCFHWFHSWESDALLHLTVENFPPLTVGTDRHSGGLLKGTTICAAAQAG
jgi:hypothetical protein